MPPKATITPRVLHVLTDRPGQVLYRADIAEWTGLSEQQVGSAAYKLANDRSDVETVIRGQAWRYHANGTAPDKQRKTEAANGRCFEELLAIDSKQSILRDEDGAVYQAVLKKLSGGA